MSVVEALRQNDSGTTSIYILLRCETSDAALEPRALEENPFITEIGLDLDRGDEQQRTD